MTFNTFTWNTTQPSLTQLISDGQTTILNNFGFLGFPNGNNQNGWVEFPSGLIMELGVYIILIIQKQMVLLGHLLV